MNFGHFERSRGMVSCFRFIDYAQCDIVLLFHLTYYTVLYFLYDILILFVN